MDLTSSAKMVLSERYLGDGESPESLLTRVARAVAAPEGRARSKYTERFFELMDTRKFLPNTPTLLNAGAGNGGSLSACFVLPVKGLAVSSGVKDAVECAAKIHRAGGGTGFSFGRVPRGVLAAIQRFDEMTDITKQGGVRRGANMGVLPVGHPEALDFVRAKTQGKRFQNFNLSMAADDKFMREVIEGKKKALSLWSEICKSAWKSGDPGLVFLDRMNFFNSTPQVAEFEATNPCGEQPLLAFESCNLGSLNLNEYMEAGGDSESEFADVKWAQLAEDIALAVRFLDNVIEINDYPVPESAKITKRNRKIGLGVMGFADLLLRMGLPYDSPRARSLGERIMAFVDSHAKEASQELAKERGEFEGWSKSMWKTLGYAPLRNATVTTVAPTGSISIIAGCSSGIEPIFSAEYSRKILEGKSVSERAPGLDRTLLERGLTLEPLGETTDDIDGRLTEVLGVSWSPARKVSFEAHVKMQAAFQRFSDSAVSKTINLPSNATVEDVSRAYILAFRLGCKGITVFREGCLGTNAGQIEAVSGCLACV